MNVGSKDADKGVKTDFKKVERLGGHLEKTHKNEVGENWFFNFGGPQNVGS